MKRACSRYSCPKCGKVYNINSDELKPKKIIKEQLCQYIDFSQYEKTFNIVLITRFEARKCHDRLLKAFFNLVKENKNLRRRLMEKWDN